MEENLVTLQLSVADESLDDERLDELTTQLTSQLQDLDIATIERPSTGSGPMGAKGDPITIGVLMLAILPAVLPSLVSLIQNILVEGRKVRLKAGEFEVEFTPQKQFSKDEILALEKELKRMSKK